MKKKTSYAVFTKTGSGLDFIVKGNFGDNEELANKWAKNHSYDTTNDTLDYPNGLFVKKVKH